MASNIYRAVVTDELYSPNNERRFRSDIESVVNQIFQLLDAQSSATGDSYSSIVRIINGSASNGITTLG